MGARERQHLDTPKKRPGSSRPKDTPPRISVLFLAADPSDGTRLRLGKEFRQIKAKLGSAKRGDRLKLEQSELSARPQDITQALLDIRPRIVHFSGHRTGAGKTRPLQPRNLAALLKHFADQIDCVVLDACHTQAQAQAIARHINYVIGVPQAIGDQAAIAFTAGFYQALGVGRTVEEAYAFGCSQIGPQGLNERLAPILYRKGEAHHPETSEPQEPRPKGPATSREPQPNSREAAPKPSPSGSLALRPPQPGRRDAAPKPASSPERYANYELYHLGHRGKPRSKLGANDALRMAQRYELEVWIAAEPAGKPLEDERGKRRPIRDPHNTEPATIYVVFEPSVTYFEFNENERVQTFQLPPGGQGVSAKASKASLVLRPKLESLTATALAEIGVRFYYNFCEIESFKIRAEVVGADDDPPRSRFGLAKPIQATHRKLGDWTSLDEIQRREMNILVNSLGNDRYELTFLYEQVEFKGALRLTGAEVEDVILQARNLLEYLAVDPQSPIARKAPSRLKDRVVELAQIGRSLWSKVFESERDKSLWYIGEFLTRHPLKRDGIIQITLEDNAAGFVFPWNLLYDGRDPLDPNATVQDLLEGFWGMRYSLEQFHGAAREAWSERPAPIGKKLQMSFMLKEDLADADTQLKFIAGLPERSQRRIDVGKPIVAAERCYQLLQQCASHILYFYAVGHTRRRQADLAVQPDVAPGEQGQPEPEKSYIELTGEKLYLERLEVSKRSIHLLQKPVVFLNMCEGAQITPSLSEGFVPFFLDQRAAAVISTECPMTTDFAHPFAVAFFEALLRGLALGTALLKARRKFLTTRQHMAPLGLAYTLYGLATVRYQPAPLSRGSAGARAGPKN